MVCSRDETDRYAVIVLAIENGTMFDEESCGLDVLDGVERGVTVTVDYIDVSTYVSVGKGRNGWQAETDRER